MSQTVHTRVRLSECIMHGRTPKIVYEAMKASHTVCHTCHDRCCVMIIQAYRRTPESGDVLNNVNAVRWRSWNGISLRGFCLGAKTRHCFRQRSRLQLSCRNEYLSIECVTMLIERTRCVDAASFDRIVVQVRITQQQLLRAALRLNEVGDGLSVGFSNSIRILSIRWTSSERRAVCSFVACFTVICHCS